MRETAQCWDHPWCNIGTDVDEFVRLREELSECTRPGTSATLPPPSILFGIRAAFLSISWGCVRIALRRLAAPEWLISGLQALPCSEAIFGGTVAEHGFPVRRGIHSRFAGLRLFVGDSLRPWRPRLASLTAFAGSWQPPSSMCSGTSASSSRCATGFQLYITKTSALGYSMYSELELKRRLFDRLGTAAFAVRRVARCLGEPLEPDASASYVDHALAKQSPPCTALRTSPAHLRDSVARGGFTACRCGYSSASSCSRARGWRRPRLLLRAFRQWEHSRLPRSLPCARVVPRLCCTPARMPAAHAHIVWRSFRPGARPHPRERCRRTRLLRLLLAARAARALPAEPRAHDASTAGSNSRRPAGLETTTNVHELDEISTKRRLANSWRVRLATWKRRHISTSARPSFAAPCFRTYIDPMWRLRRSHKAGVWTGRGRERAPRASRRRNGQNMERCAADHEATLQLLFIVLSVLRLEAANSWLNVD